MLKPFKTKSLQNHEKQCNIELKSFAVEPKTAVPQTSFLVLVLPNVISNKYHNLFPPVKWFDYV